MNFEDFAFLLFIPYLLVPLVAVYFVMKRLEWEPKDRLFLDSWFVWLIWLASAVFSYIAVIAATSKMSLYWGMGNLEWIVLSIFAVLVSNICAISILVWLLRRSRSNDEIHLYPEDPIEHKESVPILRISTGVAIAATGSFLLIFAFVLVAGSVREHYFPKPKSSFAIYD